LRNHKEGKASLIAKIPELFLGKKSQCRLFVQQKLYFRRNTIDNMCFLLFFPLFSVAGAGIVFFCVAATIINVAGFMHFWGLTIGQSSANSISAFLTRTCILCLIKRDLMWRVLFIYLEPANFLSR
jgi:hypothetical protein